METAINYNDNTAYFSAKKSGRTQRILRKLNFLLLCNHNFNFCKSDVFYKFSKVLVFGSRLGIWLIDACFQVFWIQLQLKRAQNPRDFE